MPGYRYNSVSLQHCKTLSFEMEQEFDPSNTDAIWMKYTIRVRGFVVCGAGTFPGSGSPVTSATSLVALKALLETPRRPMSYSIGAVLLTTSQPSGLDDKKGPIPLPAVVTEATSGTFMVECGCILRLYECLPYNCPPSKGAGAIVSLRWTQSEAFDENFYSRLKTKGRVIVRSSLLQAADNFRPWCVPDLPNNYKRMGASYTASPDGLEMEFEFDDVEVDRLPPPLADAGDGTFGSGVCTNASGTYKVEVKAGGASRVGTVTIRLEGSRGTSRQSLMIRALGMCYAKLKADWLQNNDSPVISGNVEEDLFVPKVSVTMTSLMAPLTAPGALFGPAIGVAKSVAVMPSVGATRYNSSGLSANLKPLTPPQRKAIAFLAAAAFLDPCGCISSNQCAQQTPLSEEMPKEVREAIKKVGSRGDAQVPGGPVTGISLNTTGSPTYAASTGTYGNQILANTPAADISIGVLPPITPTAYVRDTAPYTFYQLESSTTFESGLAQLPGTGTGPNPNVGAMVSYSGQKMTLTVIWSAQRIGQVPELPAYLSPDPNLVPIYGTLVCQDTSRAADGNQLQYTLAGYYQYAILDPEKYDIVTPLAPYLGTAEQPGAAAAVTYFTNNAYWAIAQQAPDGANPFITAGAAIEAEPSVPVIFNQDPGGTQDDTQTQSSGQSQGGTTYNPPILP